MTDSPQTCTRCKKIKPSDKYKMCEKCRALLRGQYYRLRKENERARGRWMAEMKAKMACHDCGASYPENPSYLQWDHRPGEIKVASVSELVFDGKVDETLEEIKKCDLVCPRCHARRGVERGQIPTGPQSPRVMLRCEQCNKEVHRWPHQIKRSNHHYCSQACSAKARIKPKPVKLKIHHWKPPKRQWWWGQTILDSAGNVVERYNERGEQVPI